MNDESEEGLWGVSCMRGEWPGNKTKRIIVGPDERLSIQSHNLRAELRVVVRGNATATVDDRVFNLAKGAAADIPRGAKHRLANRTQESLEIIEVQFGVDPGKDDITRYENIHGRS